MSPFVKKVLGAKVKTLLYYGDTDMACNFLLGQQFASQLGYRVIKNNFSNFSCRRNFLNTLAYSTK